LRVAVITSESREISNALWYQLQDADEVVIFGGPSAQEAALPACHRTLEERDFGGGLLRRHLVGLGTSLDAYQPELIHVNGELWSVTVQTLLGRAEPLAVHGAENVWQRGSLVQRRVRDALIARAVQRIDGYASWNYAGAQYVQDRVPDGVPTLVMPAIVPPPLFPLAVWHRRYDAGASPFKVLCVGSLVAQKGFDCVLRAIGMSSMSDRYEVVICGTGPEQDALAALAETVSVKCSFLGHVDPAELVSLMTTSDCLVQPSRTVPGLAEQFGRSVAEAMRVGLPCIVSSSGELPSVVGNPNAVFPEGDANALSARLEKLRMSEEFALELSATQRCAEGRWSGAEAIHRVHEFWEAVQATGAARAQTGSRRKRGWRILGSLAGNRADSARLGIGQKLLQAGPEGLMDRI